MSDVYEEEDDDQAGTVVTATMSGEASERCSNEFVVVRLAGTQSMAPDEVTVTRAKMAADMVPPAGAAVVAWPGEGDERDEWMDVPEE